MKNQFNPHKGGKRPKEARDQAIKSLPVLLFFPTEMRKVSFTASNHRLSQIKRYIIGCKCIYFCKKTFSEVDQLRRARLGSTPIAGRISSHGATVQSER